MIELLSVFISHSSSDYEVITKVKETLEVQGFYVYLAEEDVRAGTYLPAKIEEAIRRCDVVLAILTSKASKSAWVQQELGYAKAIGKLIIPLVEEEVNVTGFLTGVEYIRFDPRNLEPALQKIKEYLTRLKESKEFKEMLGVLILIALGAFVAYYLTHKK